ncbi:hypothetical protein [Ralstonia pseudosolanacearum]|uniref:hypothetical protein n=1 Tax=Ralstonia pseudosolanacearum TaxID=1310165 RepID=UPI003CFD6F68
MLNQNPQLWPGNSLWQKANKAAGNHIGVVSSAFQNTLPISGQAALLATLGYAAAVCQVLGAVTDSKRRKIASVFCADLFTPVTTCGQVIEMDQHSFGRMNRQ